MRTAASRATRVFLVGVGVVAAALCAHPASADTWLGWRGAERQGRAESAEAPVRWSLGSNVAWRARVPGEGYSSPIVTEKAVYVTAAVPAPGGRSPAAPYRWVVWGLTALLAIGAAAMVARASVVAVRSAESQAGREHPIALGVLVVWACWWALYSEHFLGFGRGPERAWLAAGVVGTLSLAASGLLRGARGLLPGVLLLALGAVLQATVPNIGHAYEDGLLSPKSLFHYAVVAIPLATGIAVLLRRRLAPAGEPGRREGKLTRWLGVVPLLLLGLGIVALVLIDQRKGALVLTATPYQPRLPLWLPVALGGPALLAWFRRKRNPSSIWGHLDAFAVPVAALWLTTAVLSERLLAGSGYLAYQLGKPRFEPLLGETGMCILVGLPFAALVAAVCSERRRPGILGSWVDRAFQGAAIGLAAAFFVYAMYAPKDAALLYRVLSFDRQTGKLNWGSDGVIGPRGPMHSDNAPATPTPVSDGERLYAWFGTPGLECVDATGRQLWVNRDLPFRARHGVATSPILCAGKVLILSESEAGCYLAAIDAATGKEFWRTERRKGTHRYAGTCRTPTVERIAGRETIIVWGHKDLSGYDPASGRQLWSHDIGDLGRSGNPVASPVSDSKRFYLIGLERIMAVDIQRLPASESPVAWELERRTGAQCASPVLCRGLLFVASDKGPVYCLDPVTGKLLWEKRLPGVNYASPIAVGGSVYFCSTAGRTTVVEAAREYREVAVSDLREVVHASFAPVDEQLFVRTAEHLYCLREGAGGVSVQEDRPPSEPRAKPPERPAAAGGPDLAADWNRFRGASGNGVSGHADVPTKWNGAVGEGVVWRTAVPLPGYGSPVIGGDRVYCTGGDGAAEQVYCFDAGTGKLLWTGDAPSGSSKPEVSEMTGYAPSTPVTDGRRLCAIFPSGTVVCFDRNGKRLWDRNLGVPENNYGHASSLVASGDRVFVQYDQGAEGDERSRLLALDLGSGKTVWEVQRETAASWATPLLIRAEEREELVTSAQPWIIAYDPATGQELWRAGCMSGEVAPSPILAGGLLFTVSDRASLSAIRPGGSGDVTASHVLWSVYDGLPDTCSPVSDGKLVYLLTSGGLLTCIEAADGATVWQEQLDGTFRASPSLAANRLYLVSDAGDTHLLAAGREFRQLARLPLGEPVGASPAFAQGRVYLRGEKHLYCLGQ